MKIAVTGGIGSGKSEVMKILKNYGFSVYSADEINAGLLLNKDYILEIEKHFPNAVKNCAIDRGALREEVFSSSEKRELLNSIAHPKIRSEIEKIDGVVEVPLLFESGMQDLFDKIIVITAKRETKIQRIMTRGLGRDIAEKIIDSQLPDEYKIANADYVVVNDYDLLTLKNNVDEVMKKVQNGTK